MGFFSDLLKGFIVEKDSDTSPKLAEVLLRETIKRSSVFQKEYKQWLMNGMENGLLDYIKECYQKSISGDQEVNFYVFKQPNSNGFYFRSESPWNVTDYSFLIQLFIDRLKSMDYYLNNSVREAVEENGSLKTIEEFYLKPKLKYRKEIPYNQLYGNVFIQHRIEGEQTDLLKIMVHSYNDHHFKPPSPYEEFLRELLRFT